MELETYFKTEREKETVKFWIDRYIHCRGDELFELYTQANEYWFENDMNNFYAAINPTQWDFEEYLKKNGYEAHTEEWLEELDYFETGHEDYTEYGSFMDELRDQQEPQEVFQWFIVDNWLASKLIEHGEPVLETENHFIWGRTCCGQSIELDGTFQEIYRNTYSEEN